MFTRPQIKTEICLVKISIIYQNYCDSPAFEKLPRYEFLDLGTPLVSCLMKHHVYIRQYEYVRATHSWHVLYQLHSMYSLGLPSFMFVLYDADCLYVLSPSRPLNVTCFKNSLNSKISSLHAAMCDVNFRTISFHRWELWGEMIFRWLSHTRTRF